MSNARWEIDIPLSKTENQNNFLIPKPQLSAQIGKPKIIKNNKMSPTKKTAKKPVKKAAKRKVAKKKRANGSQIKYISKPKISSQNGNSGDQKK